MKVTQTLCYLCVLLLTFAMHGVEAIGRMTREDILENHAKRKKQIAKLLEDTKAALADHDSGVRRLDEEEHAKHTKRVDLYKRKLDTMKDEPDDREIERMLEREKMRAERYEKREL